MAECYIYITTYRITIKYLIGCTLYDFYCDFLFSKYKIKNLAVFGLFFQKMAENLKLLTNRSQKLPS